MNVYHLIMAFQHFAGKPLYCLDAVNALTKEHKRQLFLILAEIAMNLINMDENDYPQAHELSEQIKEELKKV